MHFLHFAGLKSNCECVRTCNYFSFLVVRFVMASIDKQQVAEQGSSRVPTTLRDFFFNDPIFETNWTDFDKLQSAMMKEPRDLFKKMDEDFR